MPDFPQSILDFRRQFPHEAACVAWLAAARWPEGFRRPVCGHDHAWELDAKASTWECAERHRQMSVTAGAVIHGSNLPLRGVVLGVLSDGHPLERDIRPADGAAVGAGVL